MTSELRWDHLAYWLKRSREELGWSRPQAATAGDVSPGLVEKYETGNATRGGRLLRQYTMKALGWAYDSLDRVLDGADPALAKLPGEASTEHLPAVRRELMSGDAKRIDAAIKTYGAKLSRLERELLAKELLGRSDDT